MIETKDIQERLEEVELKVNILDNEIKNFLRKLEEGREIYAYIKRDNKTACRYKAPINTKQMKISNMENGDMVGIRKIPL